MHSYKLPIDILSIIFQECLEEDSPEYPMEIFLAVCRGWREAALLLPCIWSIYNIEIGSSADLKFWTAFIPRRLSRCNPDTLLDIEVIEKRSYDGSWSRANITASDIALGNSLLLSLAGEQGEIAQRWRSFIYNDYTLFIDHKTIFSRVLSFPTPKLEIFEAYHVESAVPILPETPALRHFHINTWKCPSFPDLRNATDMSLSGPVSIDGRAISLATQLRHLVVELGNLYAYDIFGNFPELKTLHWIGYTIMTDRYTQLQRCLIQDFSAPNLEEVKLLFGRGIDYITFIQCPGIYPEKLKRACIGWKYRVEDDIYDHLEGIEQFLRSVKSLKVLEIEGDAAAAVVLKLLCDNCDDLFCQSPPLQLRLLSREELIHEAELGQGEDERRASINRFTEDMEEFGTLQGCLADSDWDEIIEHIDAALHF